MWAKLRYMTEKDEPKERDEPLTVGLNSLRITASLKLRIDRQQADMRVQSGLRVSQADVVRLLLEEALTAREARNDVQG
jgi:hypothetical protein